MLLRAGGFATLPPYEVFWTLTHYKGKTRATDKTYRYYQILLLHHPVRDQDLRTKFYKALFNNEVGRHVELSLGSLCCRMTSRESPSLKQSNWAPTLSLFHIALKSETLLHPVQVWKACDAIGIPAADIQDIIWSARNPITTNRREKERLMEQTYICLDNNNDKIKLTWELSRPSINTCLKSALGDENLHLLYHTIPIPPDLHSQRFLYALNEAIDTEDHSSHHISPPISFQPFGPTTVPQQRSAATRSSTPKRQRQVDISPPTTPAPTPTCPELCEIALHASSNLVPLTTVHTILSRLENAVMDLYKIDIETTLVVLDYYKQKVGQCLPKRNQEDYERDDSDIFGSDSN